MSLIGKKVKVKAVIFLVVIIAGIIGSFGVYSKNGEKTKEENVPIRFSDSTTPNNYELVKNLTGRDIAVENNLNLIPVTVQGGEGGTVTMQALLADNIDVSGGSISIWVNAVSKGAKVKLVCPQSVSEKAEYSGLLALKDSNINSIKDLAGKRIAVNVLGAEADFIIKKFLKENGLDINQVELVVVPAANEEQALRTKQVDAAAWTTSGSTYFDHTVETGGVIRIQGTSSIETRGKSMLNCSEGFRTEFIEKHPDVVHRYVKAEDTAAKILVEEYNKDPERVRKAYAEVSKEKGSNPDLAKYYRGPRVSATNELITDDDVNFWIDNFVASGTLKEGQVKAVDVYTNEFSPNYQK